MSTVAAASPSIALPPKLLIATLKRGDQGAVVRAFQEQLSKLGFLLHTPDGKFGPQTEQDLKAFQLAVGLEPTGLLNMATRKALSHELADKPMMPKRLPAKLTLPQRRLAAFAYRALLAKPKAAEKAPTLKAPLSVRIDALLGGKKEVVVDQGRAWLKQTTIVPGSPTKWTDLGTVPAALLTDVFGSGAEKEAPAKTDRFVAAKA